MPKLEFLTNMNISPLTVEQLRKNGWNIVRVSEVMDRGSKDQRKERWVGINLIKGVIIENR